MDAAAFRSEFPVLKRIAYLNAGTYGPLPARSVEAGHEWWRRELEGGRSGGAHFEGVVALLADLRGRLAALLGAELDAVELTRSTTDGINLVLGGLSWSAGDEVLTSTEEHPGLLAPLGRLRQRHGVEVRAVPLEALPGAVGPRTRLVAVSHVTWTTGALAPVEPLAALEVPVLYDGAQALGAIPVDVARLGCDYYAAPGQKWLCGPAGTGCLYVRGDRLEEMDVPWPNYEALADPERALEVEPGPGAQRLAQGAFPGQAAAAWLASLELLEEAGWEWVWRSARERAEELRAMLRGRFEVAPGSSTLVSWAAAAAHLRVGRLADMGVAIRSIPGRGLLRASVGAWNSEEDLERLVVALRRARV